MINKHKIILNGQRVQLLPMNMNHLDTLYMAIIADEKWENVWRYRIDKVKNKDDLRKYMELALAGVDKGDIIPFVIFDKKLNKIVGTTRFADISQQHRSLEIGWTSIAPEVMRSRVNTECKYLLLKYCFEDAQLARVCFKTLSINERSQKAILRIGAIKEGEFRWAARQVDGTYVNVVFFSIIEPEWPDVKKRLERLLAQND